MKKLFSSQGVTVLLFALSLSLLFVGQILTPDLEISSAERRPLAERPSLSYESVRDGEFFEEYEEYLLDQAVFRESFRSIKALSSYYLLLKKDHNGIYLYQNGLYEIDVLNESSVVSAGKKIDTLSDRLEGITCYYAFVPDKNSLVASESGRPSVDLARMSELLKSTVKSAAYLDISGLLTVEDYYRTDLHWRQERLLPIANALLRGMNNNAVQYSFSETVIDGFCGAYYGQAALPLVSEKMSYLSFEGTSDVTVSDLTTGETIPLYDEAAFESYDPYSLFVGGSRSLVRIENPNAQTEKTLYLFRDSFASSLAPLLLSGYSEIIMIDLRYIDSRSLDTFVDFKSGSDALFLYSSHILNESTMLR